MIGIPFYLLINWSSVDQFYLQSFTHASANDQQVYSLLQHLLQISRLDPRVMLERKTQDNVGSLFVGETLACYGFFCCFGVCSYFIAINMQSCTWIYVFRLWFHSHRSQSLSSPRPGFLQATPYSPCSLWSIPSPSCGPRKERRSLERTCCVRLSTVRNKDSSK